MQRPASGVVTALEPIMRVCGGGIWVAHGSGSADREVVDQNNEVKVPPEIAAKAKLAIDRMVAIV